MFSFFLSGAKGDLVERISIGRRNNEKYVSFLIAKTHIYT